MIERIVFETDRQSFTKISNTTSNTNGSSSAKLNFEEIQKVIDKMKYIVEESNPIYSLAKENGFDLLAGDIALVPIGMMHGLNIEETDNIKPNHFSTDIMFISKNTFEKLFIFDYNRLFKLIEEK